MIARRNKPTPKQKPLTPVELLRKLFDRFKVEAFYAIYKTELSRANGDTTLGFAEGIRHTMDCPDDAGRFWRWYEQICLPGHRHKAEDAVRKARCKRTPETLLWARKMCRVHREIRKIGIDKPSVKPMIG